MTNVTPGDVKAALDFASNAAAPQTINVKHPDGREDVAILTRGSGGETRYHMASDLFEALVPQRRKGTIAVHDLPSFIAAVNRDKRADSVIFADVPGKNVVAVLDFHGPAESAPRFGQDRIAYGFQLSPQLLAWQKAEASGAMDQKTFSRLIDDRLGDIGEAEGLDPRSLAADFAKRRGIAFATIADLVVFTRTIAAKSSVGTKEEINETTGDVAVQYMKKNSVETPDGKAILPPAAFLLQIPVLNGEKATIFSLAVRLRFDIDDRSIKWRIEINALDKYLQAAAQEVLDTVRRAPDAGGCGLPVYLAATP